MSDVTITPNMNLPVPVVGSEPGPDWAEDINACFDGVDAHNHSPGQGVQIGPDGININADLPMNENNLTRNRAVKFTSQASPLSLLTDIGCLYVSGNNLYYNDGTGSFQVQITSAGSVVGSTGTITGLPSGTASASFSGGTFTFQSATSTPASMNIGPAIIGAAVASSKTVTLTPQNTQPANYSLTFPPSLPGAGAIVGSDASGQLNFTSPDNSSFGIASSTYQVLNLGITNAKIANATITASKLATANLVSCTSGASQTFGATSYTTIPGMTQTITATGGRPISIVFSSEPGSGNNGFYYTDSNDVVSFQVTRNGTPIAKTEFKPLAASIQAIPSWTTFDNTPSVGINTYAFQCAVTSGTTLTIQYCGLWIMEI